MRFPSHGLAWLLALLLGAMGARATPTPSVLEVQFRSVAVPDNSVPALAQDRAGFLWVATSKGLTRYDGYRLRPIEGRGDTSARRNLGWVRALSPSRDGRMWIGTEFKGLMAYDPERDQVEPQGSLKGLGGPHAPIRALAEDGQGGIWVGTLGEGLQRYDPATRRFAAQDLRWQGQPERRVLALKATRDGAIWVGHWRGLARLHRGQWQAFDMPGLPDGTPVLALTEGEDGRVWLGTQDGRLGVVEQGRLRWVLTGVRHPVQALAEAADGRLWVGSKGGLYWLNAAQGTVLALLRQDPRRPQGLAGNDISGLLRDQGGAMWVSGYGLGLQRHQHHPALSVRGPDSEAGSPLPEVDVRAVLTLRNGEVLAATQRGPVVRLDGRPGHELATLGQWPRERPNVVESLAEAADGSLWMVGGGRLEHRRADGRLIRDWPLDGGRAQRLLLRRNGEVWLGMQEGLFRLDGPDAPAPTRVHLSGGAPLHGGIYALIEDGRDASLWVGGQQGLFHQRGGVLSPVPQAPQEDLGSPVVMGLLLARDGTLWVDTPVSGLHRRKGVDDQGRSRFDRVSERQGLDGLFGANLHEDAEGRIWSQVSVYDPRADRIDSFGAAEGAAFGSAWFFASTELPGGRLLFGGSRGLLQVQPAAYRPALGGPPLVISALRVNGLPFQPDSLRDGLVLRPGTRSLGVEFAGLDYADPARVRYQYRLQDLDADWTHVDASARSPSFGPLKPGRYTLQLRAAPHQGARNASQLDLPIVLLPAWWQTAWAQAGAGLLGMWAVWGLVQWRTRALRRREAELQALVDARTAELREASLTDALTGLRNRRYLELRLADDVRLCLRRFEAPGQPVPGPDSDLVLMLLDLDHFKQINDQHGHAAGDAVLVKLAERLRREFRETDSLVRWGGEEVLVLVRETSRNDAAELAARVCAAVRDQPFEVGPGQQIRVTGSIGFAAFPLDPKRPRVWDWQASLGLADAALYAAKAQGRDGFVGALSADGLAPDEVPNHLGAWLSEPRLKVARSG